MAVQTGNYSYAHGKAYEGQIASAFHLIDTESMVIKTANIPAGRFVKLGSDEGTVEPATSATAIYGMVPYQNVGVENDSGVTENEDRTTDIVTKGTAWVVCQDGCSPMDDVFVIVNSAGGGVVGQTRTDADTANAIAINGKYLTTAAAGELAKIQFNTLALGA